MGVSRPSLDGKHFDVAIIGGGINGVAIARECARAGQRVLILEAHDFAAGTTSRSTRIIHGGLRYLEHGEIALVRESLRERQRLLADRPHLVRPRSFLLALPANQHGARSALSIRFGLWLYSHMAGTSGAKHSLAAETARLETELDRGSQWTIFDYEDAQCEFPERLVAEWLSEAIDSGAIARNHTEALEILSSLGRATGVALRDRFTHEEFRIHAKWIINATGPWADRVCADSGINTRAPMIGGVRGTHIVLDRPSLVPGSAIYVQAADGRPIFVVPWNGALLAGTTEVGDHGDPAQVEPTPAEIGYLVNSLRRLFPRAAISWSDISYAFAGVRPLPFVPACAPSTITRRHLLHDHRNEGVAGLISVIGGKLTTAASLARDCARMLGLVPTSAAPAFVALIPNNGVAVALDRWAQDVSTNAAIGKASARAIAEFYGPHALEVVRTTRNNGYLQKVLCPESPHILAEAAYAVQSECAVTLADILLRRVPIALSPNWSADSTRGSAHSIARVLGWTQRDTDAEIALFEEERAQFLHKVAPESASAQAQDATDALAQTPRGAA